MEVLLNGARTSLSPKKSIGKGGEADIYDIGRGKALKVYKMSDHPDYDGLPLEQQAADLRIALHQEKLPAFPGNLPDRVIAPEELATETRGRRIIGYTMRYLKGGEILRKLSVKDPQGRDRNAVCRIFLDLHRTLRDIHRAGVVIGDFNDLNVLLMGQDAYLIDADSFQYGKFLCMVYTARFLDPLLCDPASSALAPVRQFNALSDWFSYTVMLMQSLLHVDPYGGVYAPVDPSMRLTHDLRPLRRITIFHPDVRYPKSAIHYSALPDELLEYFHKVFLNDNRGEFPRELISSMHWTKCPSCGIEHARSHCPVCVNTGAAEIPVTVVRGEVTVTRMFKTMGIILTARAAEGRLTWLYHEGGKYCREDGSVVFKGELKPGMRFGLCGRTTVAGENERMAVITPGKLPVNIQVDSQGNEPAFDTNGRDLTWIRNGQIFRSGDVSPEFLGDVLEGQTFFRIGPKFGFGYYRAGSICVSFVFDIHRRRLNDNLKIPWLRHPVIGSTCYFTDERCWLFLATQENGRTIHRCIVILANGTIEAIEEGLAGDGSWLSSLSGKCAARNFLLAATDEGLVRVEPQEGTIVRTREFPDTEGIVDDGTRLFPGKGGLFAVRTREISFMKIG